VFVDRANERFQVPRRRPLEDFVCKLDEYNISKHASTEWQLNSSKNYTGDEIY